MGARLETWRMQFEPAQDILGGKWRASLVWGLAQGPSGLSRLRRELNGPADKVILENLSFLQSRGFLERQGSGSKGQRVLYTLTPKGRSLLPLLDALRQWAQPYTIPSARDGGPAV